MKNTDQHIAQNVNTGLSYANQPDEISLFDVFDILLKFKWLFVISFFVVLLGSLFIVHRLPIQKQYTQYISMPSYTDGSGNLFGIINQDEVSMTIKQMISHGGLPDISVTTPNFCYQNITTISYFRFFAIGFSRKFKCNSSQTAFTSGYSVNSARL